MSFVRAAVAALALAGSAVAQRQLPPITMKGNKFFYENGTQFFMKGIAYQQDTAAAGQTNTQTNTYIDPLADEKACERDVPLLQELGINIIRTYAINPNASHDGCMRLLQDAGIYVISDLSEPALSVNRDDPQWTTAHFNRFKAVIDELAQYSNVLGFFAGNEVSNNKSNTEASAYIKAAVRDTKRHIRENHDRWFGVGYAANDDPEINEAITDYFNCGNETDVIDFWGYNIYSWCGESSYKASSYELHTKTFTDFPVPVFFAEFGCNEPDGAGARIYEEIDALFGDEMSNVFSGGIHYMYFQEENDYGVVEIENGRPVKQPDFERLADKYHDADPRTVDESDYSGDNAQAPSCPDLDDVWRANTNLPPTPDSALCDCMVRSLTCVRSEDLDEEDYGDIFGLICGDNPELCSAISANATTGVYGAYSMCEAGPKLDFVMDAYYQDQNKAASACDFRGQAQTKNANAPSSCDDPLEAAASHNEIVATATAPVSNDLIPGNDGNGNGNGNGNSDEDDDSAAIRGASVMGLATLGAFFGGVAMIVL